MVEFQQYVSVRDFLGFQKELTIQGSLRSLWRSAGRLVPLLVQKGDLDSGEEDAGVFIQTPTLFPVEILQYLKWSLGNRYLLSSFCFDCSPERGAISRDTIIPQATSRFEAASLSASSFQPLQNQHRPRSPPPFRLHNFATPPLDISFSASSPSHNFATEDTISTFNQKLRIPPLRPSLMFLDAPGHLS